MNRSALKTYAPKARKDFIAAMVARAAKFGITKKQTLEAREQGDLIIIGSEAFPRKIAEPRRKLISRIKLHGFDQAMEEVAYTWFNRLLAIRYMELHGYLDHGYRVLSHPSDKAIPEILEHAEHLDFPGLNKGKVVDLKLDGTKDAELYRMLLIAQCNALHRAMPFLFERIDDETELLLPDNLLHSDSLIRKLVTSIDEADWQEIEIIGWLYQFYISEKKDEVMGKVVKSEDIPAATQLFTPNWIVKYMVQNALGAQWIATYPESPLKAEMDYYIEPADQPDEVRQQLADITPQELNPEELTLMDPACGSGHILVEAYDLFKAIYLERGYRLRDIPRLILEKNIYGLDIDDRAAQMAGFALLMKARADDRRILSSDTPPVLNVMSIQDSKGLDADEMARTLVQDGRYELVPSDDLLPETVKQPMLSGAPVADDLQGVKEVVEIFDRAKTYGTLIKVPQSVTEFLPKVEAIVDPSSDGGMFVDNAKAKVRLFLKQAKLLSAKYNCVVANPPYMGMAAANSDLKKFLSEEYNSGKIDLYSAFILRCHALTSGRFSMVVQHSWMFLSRFEGLRDWFLSNASLSNAIHLGPRAFEAISGEVVQSVAFSAAVAPCDGYLANYFDATRGNSEDKRQGFLARRLPQFRISQGEYRDIPRSNFVYWIGERTSSIFRSCRSLESFAKPRHGMVTSDNDRFLRLWWEVDFSNANLKCHDREESVSSGAKWFPYNKGGGNRKWFGHNEYFVNWENDGAEIIQLAADKYGSPSRQIQNTQYYFKDGITWSSLSSENISMRSNGPGFLFDSKGNSMFFDEGVDQRVYLALCNSSVAAHFMHMLAPTLDFNAGAVAKLPVPDEVENGVPAEVISSVDQLRSTSRADWDTFETSWGFKGIDYLHPRLKDDRISVSIRNFLEYWALQSDSSRELEEAINEAFIKLYKISGEVSDQVTLREVSLARNTSYSYDSGGKPEEIDGRVIGDIVREFVSFACGCMMGRYSIAEPGLIYAGSGNEGFDPSRYGAFLADDDGIVPVTESEWFDDDAAVRFEEFLRVTWSPEMLPENLRFVAESLAANGGNDPQKTIRNYFSKSFFKDHQKTYKKRPIYWLFSSGKLKAFECLVYLHRYNESTLSRMRMEYVTPLQSRMAARIDQLADDIAAASSSAARNKAQKERDLMVKQLEELRVFDEELRHFADQRITLDLDEGVKVNYAKFGNLLADRKAITGEK
ncbi:restriction enzyme [Defluviimonas sp. 20V17]|nr:restriction enzyme [Defluviimonas sp. 20V17]